MSDTKTLSIVSPDEDLPAPAEVVVRKPVLLGSRELSQLVDEVAVHLSVALALAGVEDTFEVDATREEPGESAQGDLWSPETDECARLIKFVDAEGAQLPVYVSCLDDGLLLCVVSHEDGTHAYADPRTMKEIDDLVDDVRRAIEAEIPTPTYH